MFKETPPRQKVNHDYLSEAEEKAFELIVAEQDKKAIQMDDFEKVPGYGSARIQHDKERIAKKKTDIHEMGTEPAKTAKLLEAILTEQIELSNWFGDNTYTTIPSEYDDFFHGVDLALQIKDEEQEVKHLAMGIDVTTSPMYIRKKLGIIKTHIQDGTLTMIEYFHSDDYDPDFYGAMMNIPQVIIGAERKTIQELSDLWMTGYGRAKLRKKTAQPALSPEVETSQRAQAKEAKKKLGNHRIQIILLEEIKMQLSVFNKFALRSGQGQAAEKFTSVLGVIELILKGKEIDGWDAYINSSDSVFKALEEALNDFDNL